MAHAARSLANRDFTLLIGCVLLSLVAQGLPERLRAPLSASLRRTVVAPLISLQGTAEATRRAWQTRDERTAARDSVVLRSLALDGVAAENARLRALLGLGRQLRWGFIPAEVLHVRGVGEEYTVTLSVGSRGSVVPFSPVVAPEGLVGMVRTVDPNMSMAILWSHRDFRVSAMAADASTFGIVAPHQAQEPERYLLELRGVPFRSALRPGTLVVSSGLGAVFPRGIPVGTVLGELKTSEAWARTYLLRPAVMPADVGSVMILRPERVEAGVTDVWSQARGADSAMRSIAAAGDSLARLSAPVKPSEADTGRRAPTTPAPVAPSARADSAVRRREPPPSRRDPPSTRRDSTVGQRP